MLKTGTNPSISVITPMYNAEKTIRQCVLSILNSDFDKEAEIIVVDDGSTDQSLEKIKDLNVRIIKQENKGAAAARNTGAGLTKSRLLLFVDSDVIFLPDTLRRIYEHLSRDDVDYVTVRYSEKPANEKWIHKYKALADYCYYYYFISTKQGKNNVVKKMMLGGGTEGYKKKVFVELGGFDEGIKGAHIEREALYSKLRRDYNIIGDASITAMHFSPGLKEIISSYLTRVSSSMGLVVNNNYGSEPYLAKNAIRVALGALSVAAFIASLIAFLFFKSTWQFTATGIIFSTYLFSHLNMFTMAFREYGFFFMLYTLAINLFFCSLITLAGFLGTVKALMKR